MATDPTVQSNGIKVLFIEDEHFISELYNRALLKAGYDVTTLLDGVKGLEEAKTDKYDIILLDLMIPTMTGVEVLRRLRQEKPDIKAKILITTNLDQREEIRNEIEKQADGYLLKAEITPKELIGILQKVL